MEPLLKPVAYLDGDKKNPIIYVDDHIMVVSTASGIMISRREDGRNVINILVEPGAEKLEIGFQGNFSLSTYNDKKAILQIHQNVEDPLFKPIGVVPKS